MCTKPAILITIDYNYTLCKNTQIFICRHAVLSVYPSIYTVPPPAFLSRTCIIIICPYMPVHAFYAGRRDTCHPVPAASLSSDARRYRHTALVLNAWRPAITLFLSLLHRRFHVTCRGACFWQQGRASLRVFCRPNWDGRVCIPTHP